MVLLIVGVIQQLIIYVGTSFFANLQNGLMITLGIQHLAQSLTNPILSCVLIVQYFNLRVTMEGFGVEKLTEQFSIAGDTEQVKG